MQFFRANRLFLSGVKPRFILTTLYDEAVDIPISYAREMAVYNSEKVKDIAFADNPYSLDMTRVIVFPHR